MFQSGKIQVKSRGDKGFHNGVRVCNFKIDGGVPDGHIKDRFSAVSVIIVVENNFSLLVDHSVTVFEIIRIGEFACAFI